MLGYFPTPYPDELLYSMVARYALHTGLKTNHRAVVREVFSSPTATAIPDLPSHLEALTQNLQAIWAVDACELIRSYTLAPIYLPFLSNTQAGKITEAMCSNRGNSIHTRTGIAASAIKQVELFRFCPTCLKEQLSTLGEAYWLRQHQLPGLDYCKAHSCLLKQSEVPFHPKERHCFYSATSTLITAPSEHLQLSKLEQQIYLRYTELLTLGSLRGLGTNRWTLFYRELASQHDLIQKSRVQHIELYERIRSLWTGSVFAPHFENHHDQHWLVDIFRKHRKSFHPLRHLLVITSLIPGTPIQQIVEEVAKLPVEGAQGRPVTIKKKQEI